ncbi:TonB-dependent Receptor Plug Domain protein [compost metagenome]
MKRSIVSILVIGGTFFANAQTKTKKPVTDTLNAEKLIEEVIITSSYGTKKLKEEVVGSIATITSKEININQSYESIDKMITGLAPGVQIGSNSELGKPVDINIRGLGTIVSLNNIKGTSTQPLIIIDGVIMREDAAFQASFFDGAGINSEMNINPLSRISTDNIETINILKDAAAVAIYGAEAANGVILITTKKGRKGKPTYSFTSQYGISQSINKVKYLNGQQFTDLINTYRRNNTTGPFTPTPWNGNDVNWFEELNKNGEFFKTNFTASGGNKYLTYRLGIDYSKNDEAKIMNTFEKSGIDASLGFDFKKLQISIYAAYNDINKNQPNTYFNSILAPTISIYDAQGNYALTGVAGITNPLAAAHQNIARMKNKSFLSSINASYQITKALKVSSVFGLDTSDKNDILWRSGLNESGRQTGSFTLDGVTYNRYGRSRINLSDSKKWNWSAQIFYEKKITENHHIDAIAGAEIRSTKDYKTAHIGSVFTNYSDYQLPWNAASYISNTGTPTYNYNLRNLTAENSGRSFFSQVNYDFAKKYYLSGTIRRDESSTFGPDRNASFNGAVGASWLVSKEQFLKNNQFLKFFRIRGSWGMTGNSRIGSYRSSGLYNVFFNGFVYEYDYAYPNPSAPPVKQLGWEKNEKLNLGFDFNFKQRFDLTIELYRNNISDMIVSRNTPLETGYNSAEINGAAMYNQGIEISGKAYWFTKKDFRWTTTFNISTVKNKVTELIGFGDQYSTAANARAQKTGVATSAIWGYKWLGINAQNGQDIFLYNGVPTDANQFSANQSTYSIIGDSQPDAIGGLNNMIMFKNFSLSFLINYQLGGDILIEDEIIDQHRVIGTLNMSVNALDYWTTPGVSATNHIPRNNNQIIPNSTKFLYDNTFLKLQNINLSYRIPLEKKQNNFVKNASIFMDCTNVLYWYKEKSPQDKNGIREFRFMYPEMRTLSFGFRANF